MTTTFIDDDGSPFFEQYPGEHLPYTLNWSTYVLNVGDTVSSTAWSATTSGLALTSALRSGTNATIWVTASDGNVGSTYVLVSKLFTVYGRIKKEPFKIKIIGLP